MQKNFKKTPMARWVSTSLAVAALSSAAIAATPLAGTLIKNYATVVYTDASGIERSVQSNEAVVTVAPVYFATIEDDLTKTAAPGNTVYLAHTLTNTGNVADTYDLSVDNGGAIYLDLNGDGQPSAGESPVTSVSVDAGQTVSLVVEHQVPTTAKAADPDVVINLTATSQAEDTAGNKVAQVTDPDTPDVPTAGDRNESGIVTSTISITEEAVIVSNKSMAYNPADNTITYTLTAKNTGLAEAYNVVIVDAIPTFVDLNGDKVAATVSNITNSGLLTNNGDTLPTETTFDEAATSIDVNRDETSADDAATTKYDEQNVPVVFAVDSELPPGTEVSVTFSISLDGASAGEAIENEYLVYEIDPAITGPVDPTVTPPIPVDPTTPPGPSNKVKHDITQTYGMTVADTGLNAADGVNDGGDDDGAVTADFTTDPLNPVFGTQTVNSAGSGETVLFQVVVTNKGNGDDIFSLSTANTDFPTGTIFTYWNADGTVQLSNMGDSSDTDVGIIPQGEERTVLVKAALPVGEVKATASNAVLSVTSHGDSAATADVNLVLGEITEPGVDIALTASDITVPNADAYVAGEKAKAVAEDIAVGGTAEFELTIENEGASPESYLLSEGVDLPSGWLVQFADAATGELINITPTLLPGATYNVKAIVTVSVDPENAKGEAGRVADPADPNSADDQTENADADTDYSFTIKATPASGSGAADEIRLAVDVATSREVTLSPATASQQTQAGGSVTYPYVVSNEGNEEEVVSITETSAAGTWAANLRIETPTGWVNVDNLATDGGDIKVTNADGTTENLTVAAGASPLTFTLKPGQTVNLEDVVASPSSAPNGATNTSQVSVTVTNPVDPANPTQVAEGITTIVPDQVRLVKMVAIDGNCDGIADDSNTFMEAQTAQVEPGQCVTWRIQATNAGTTEVTGVSITDNVPAFTTYLDPSLKLCADNKCATVADYPSITIPDPANPASTITVNAEHSAGVVEFPVGSLAAGEIYTVSFTTKVDSDDPSHQ